VFGTVDYDVYAITHCEIALVAHTELSDLCRRSPSITGHFWRYSLIRAAILREWINTGHLPAIGQIAHLLCEGMIWLEAHGLAEDKTCNFALNQVHLSQATGLSRIHVNRSLQELRRQGLLTLVNGRLTIHDWAALTQIGQFDAAYMHLPQSRWPAA
jgi:CRP-like cAMP-binding protein